MSQHRAYFKCECGRRFRSVFPMVRRGRTCPKCWKYVPDYQMVVPRRGPFRKSAIAFKQENYVTTTSNGTKVVHMGPIRATPENRVTTTSIELVVSPSHMPRSGAKKPGAARLRGMIADGTTWR